MTKPASTPPSATSSAHLYKPYRKDITMISDHDMIRAWTQVLTLSKLQPGQSVTVLTSAATHPQTLQTAIIAASAMGAIVNRLDLPPVNGEKALSRDSLAYL